ncbi:hypothetical protein ACVJMZ_003972 [Sinorhizobium medicae]
MARGIEHDKGAVAFCDRMDAERLTNVQPRFRRADGSLEPLPFVVHEGDEGDRRIEKAGRKPRKPVEIPVWDRHVRHRGLKNAEPFRRIEHLRYGWEHRLCLFMHPA